MFIDNFSSPAQVLRSPHIEKTFILEFSDWLQGSRWAKNCEYSITTTAGKVDSFLYCSGIAGIHATLIKLKGLLWLYYLKHIMNPPNLGLFSTIARYQFVVTDMETILLAFVCNLRESNFDLLVP